MFYSTVCAIAKDEDDSLREWVIYHFIIGFDHIILYDNNSKNKISDLLSDFVNENIVTVVDFPLTENQQLSAYFNCIKNWREFTKWIAFIDVDEFIVPLSCDDINDFLDNYRDFPGVGMHWDVFSSNGHLAKPQGNVIENYRMSLGISNTIKSIVQPKYVIKPSSPHHFVYSYKYCVNEEKICIPENESYPIGNDIILNHYYYKSQQDYEEKINRGLATAVRVDGKDLNRTIDEFYKHINFAEHESNAISKYFTKLEVFQEKSAKPLSTFIKQRYNLCLKDELDKMTMLIENNKIALAEKNYLKLSRYYNTVEVNIAGMYIYYMLNKYDTVREILSEGLKEHESLDAKRQLYQHYALLFNRKNIEEYIHS